VTRHAITAGRTYTIAQANNPLASVWRSSVPGDSTMPMIAAAADTIAALAHPTGTGAALLPVADLRTVSTAVAIAVAQAAVKHGLAAQPLTDPPFEPI
jgi:malate dehydrogenase (oxaloacetate-decarboxylating)